MMKSLISPITFSLLPSSSPKPPSFLLSSRSSILQIHPKFLSSLCPSFSASLWSSIPCYSSSFSSSSLQMQQHSSSSSSSGEIHVIVGLMFAGKTTSLLRRIQSESGTGRKVALIKSNKDTRYELNSIVTHDGDRYSCLALHDLSSFRQKFGSSAYDELDVICIDEAQFFEDLYDFCQKAADQDGKTIIVAGLDGDYMRKSFGSVLSIIPLADSVTKLSARCELCGKRACFTLRKTDERQTELIGGAEVYMPMCRQHYGRGQILCTEPYLEAHLKFFELRESCFFSLELRGQSHKGS